MANKKMLIKAAENFIADDDATGVTVRGRLYNEFKAALNAPEDDRIDPNAKIISRSVKPTKWKRFIKFIGWTDFNTAQKVVFVILILSALFVGGIAINLIL